MLEFIDVSVCFHSGTADEKMALELSLIHI